MNAGEKRIIVGLGLSLAIGAVVHYLYKARHNLSVLPDLPSEDGCLSSAGLVSLIEEIKHLCQIKLKELRIACAEERQLVRDQPEKYERVVLTFLTREREALHTATAEVLARHHVSKELFDTSLRCNVQLEEEARDLSNSMHIGVDGLKEKLPEGLTLEVYNTVMEAFEALLTTAVQQYKGEVPIPPFSLVLMFMRVYDELRARFRYSEFELAAAMEVYAKGKADAFQNSLKLLLSAVAPGRQVKASH